MFSPGDEALWERLSRVQGIVGYKFQDRSLLVAVLRPKEGQYDADEMTNDTLEYLGDSVLDSRRT